MKLQIIGVIDDAGDVGVLEIDAQREMVRAAHEGARIRLGRSPPTRSGSTGRGLARQTRRKRRDEPSRFCVDSDVTPRLHVTYRLHNATAMAEELGNRLLDLRAERGLTQAALAEAVGVSRKTINTVENGVFIPSTLLALKLARALGRTIEELFFLQDQ